VVIDEQDVEFAHVMHNSSGGGRMAFFFVVQNWAGEPENREPARCSRLEWFSLGAFPMTSSPAAGRRWSGSLPAMITIMKTS
jgi:hypothetical protein